MNNFISLIICTYNRPESTRRLLVSVLNQIRHFDEIIIIDSSEENNFRSIQDLSLKPDYLKYFHVDSTNRGLTLQRNFGLNHLNHACTHVTFLDDDLVLDCKFLFNIENSFDLINNAVGVSGMDMLDNRYRKKDESDRYQSKVYYQFKGWVIKEPFRYRLRNYIGLMSDLDPEKIPLFGHGRNGYPPDSGTHHVDHIMGGIATYKRHVFDNLSFSEKFKGYGLYEDFDFSVRASRIGNLYVNTSAQVWHYHEPAGRPDMFRYGRMVVRNGWYVWRLKHPHPGIVNIAKWHFITLFLTLLRLFNSFSIKKHKGSFGDFLGRLTGWFSLFIVSPNKRL